MNTPQQNLGFVLCSLPSGRPVAFDPEHFVCALPDTSDPKRTVVGTSEDGTTTVVGTLNEVLAAFAEARDERAHRAAKYMARELSGILPQE